MTYGHYPSMALDLEIRVVEDGYAVYQLDRDRLHHLNPTAALVLELCNGSHTSAELPELVQLAFGLPLPPVEPVMACLDALREQGLLRPRFVYADAGLASQY